MKDCFEDLWFEKGGYTRAYGRINKCSYNQDEDPKLCKKCKEYAVDKSKQFFDDLNIKASDKIN